MQTKVEKWGESLALRIPADLASQAGLAEDTPVEVVLIDGKLMVCPLTRKRPTLRELLARITDENIHPEVDPGPPVGKEIW